MLVAIASGAWSYAPGEIVDTETTPEAKAWAHVPLEDGSLRAVTIADASASAPETETDPAVETAVVGDTFETADATPAVETATTARRRRPRP